MKTALIPLAFVSLALIAKADTVDLDSGLVAYYKLDGNTQDSSGNGNNGALVGGLSWTTDRFGNANSALQLDRNGYVQINNSLLLNGATSGAITGWVINRMQTGEGGFVVGAGDGREGRDPFTVKFDGSQFAEAIFTDTTRDAHAADRNVGIEGGIGGARPQDQWISFVSQFTSIGSMSYFQLYLDGQLVYSEADNYFLRVLYDQPMPVQLGALTGYQDSQFRGVMDDIRIYDRALSSDEIQALSRPARVPDRGSTAAYLLFIIAVAFGFQFRAAAFARVATQRYKA
jgi:hypothetical protein